MIYYARGMELETISSMFHGSVNDVEICRDRLSASGTLYTLLVIHDRDCARNMMAVLEANHRAGENPCLLCFAQNETTLLLFPYWEERKLLLFADGQMITPKDKELVAINLVMECLSNALPWPLLYLALEQNCVQLSKDNTVYLTMILDLAELKVERTERDCVYSCARLLLELLERPAANRRGRGKSLKSLRLLRRKTLNHVYTCFPELYQDIRLTALPPEKMSLRDGGRIFWQSSRDRLFRILLVLCVLLVFTALVILISQTIFGDIPLLRLFRHTFDVIGTENLHLGGTL